MSPKLFARITPFALSILFAGCEVKTPDGVIPSDYLSDAQNFVGRYTGKMNGQRATFTLSIDSSNRGHMTYTDSDGDIVSKNCNSKIGNLVALTEKEGAFKGARFSLSTLCQIEGDSVDIEFRKNGKVIVSVLESIEYSSIPDCHDTPTGGHMCTPSNTATPNYLVGEFTKN